MASERDSLTPEAAGVDGAPPVRIRREIAQTRSQLSNTIDQIQDRLSSERLMQQAKETMRQAVAHKAREITVNTADLARTVVDRAQSSARSAAAASAAHPWRAGMLAASLGCAAGLMTRRGRPVRRAAGRNSSGPRHPVRRSLAVGVAVGLASVLLAAGRSRSRRVGRNDGAVLVPTPASRAREGWGTLNGAVTSTLQDHPLLLGLTLVLAGVVAGMAAPGSDVENRVLGPHRDALLNQATEHVREFKRTAAGRVRDVVTNALIAH